MTTVTLPPEPRRGAGADRRPRRRSGACGSDLLVASAQVDDLGTFAAGDARIGDWTGAASTAYHDGAPAGRPSGRRDVAGAARGRPARGRPRRRDGLAQGPPGRPHGLAAAPACARIADLRRRIGEAHRGRRPPRCSPRPTGCAAQVEDFGDRRHHLGHRPRRRGAGDGPRLHAGAHPRPGRGGVRRRGRPGRRRAGHEAAGRRVAGGGLRVVAGADRGAAAGDHRGRARRDRQPRRHPGRAIATRPTGSRSAATSPSSRPTRTRRDLTDHEQDLLAQRPRRPGRAATGSRAASTRSPVTRSRRRSTSTTPAPSRATARSRSRPATSTPPTTSRWWCPASAPTAASAGYQADRAIRLYEASRSLDTTETNATMFWIGYDAPDNLPTGRARRAGVLTEGMAEAGGERLADTLDGLRAIRPDDPAHLTAIGHSYGSTTLGHAAHDHGIPVDDIVVVGSPGLGGDTDHASDLGIDPEHVYAGANSRDPITYLGNHGWRPPRDRSAAPGSVTTRPRTTSAPTGSRPRTSPGPATRSFDQHSLYFDHDTESLLQHRLDRERRLRRRDAGRAQLRPVVRRRPGPRARPRPDDHGYVDGAVRRGRRLPSRPCSWSPAAARKEATDVSSDAAARLEQQRTDVRELDARPRHARWWRPLTARSAPPTRAGRAAARRSTRPTRATATPPRCASTRSPTTCWRRWTRSSPTPACRPHGDAEPDKLRATRDDLVRVVLAAAGRLPGRAAAHRAGPVRRRTRGRAGRLAGPAGGPAGPAGLKSPSSHPSLQSRRACRGDRRVLP